MGRRPGAVSGTVVAVAIVAMATGYGQFGAVSALGQVATAFGHPVHAGTVAEEAGLSGLLLGVGLAILRLASLLGLPLAASADRLGRRRTLVGWSLLGLSLTMAAAASPSYWWFVAIFAVGRPFLSAAAALGPVLVSELCTPRTRARALSVVSAGYGLGAGLNALLHSALRGVAGFRVLFVTCAVPFAVVALLARRIPEPMQPGRAEEERPRFGGVGRQATGRLAVVMGLIFATSMTSAPASSFVFVYAENVVHLGRTAESSMILLAAASGLAGLLLGRRVADRLGRRPAVAVGAVGVALSAILLYSGSAWAVVGGYLSAVLATGFLAPAGTALPNELFATSVRASVAGWGIVASVLGAIIGLLSFGLVADASGSFEVAALLVSLPILGVLLLIGRVPETRGVVLSGTLGADGRQ